MSVEPRSWCSDKEVQPLATISSNDISPEVADEVLRFLNDARKPEDIAGKEPQAGPVYDDPDAGDRDGYDIGIEVATRLLAKRNRLGRFTRLDQLSGIRGFGRDKFADLVYTAVKPDRPRPPLTTMEFHNGGFPDYALRPTCQDKTNEGTNPEPCGIRYGGNSDPLHLAYWVRGSTDKGEYSVDRIAPDDKKGVAKGAIAGADKAGESIARCVKVFDVKDVERPGRLSDLNLNSKLCPFTEREKYQVKLGCTNVDGKPYSRAVEVPVLDCDLMLLCYNFGYNKAGLARFPTGIPENKLSFPMFAAKLGENGARALCDQYIKDAAGGSGTSTTTTLPRASAPCWPKSSSRRTWMARRRTRSGRTSSKRTTCW